MSRQTPENLFCNTELNYTLNPMVDSMPLNEPSRAGATWGTPEGDGAVPRAPKRVPENRKSHQRSLWWPRWAAPMPPPDSARNLARGISVTESNDRKQPQTRPLTFFGSKKCPKKTQISRVPILSWPRGAILRPPSDSGQKSPHRIPNSDADDKPAQKTRPLTF